MVFSLSSGSESGNLTARRLATLVLVGVLLCSAVGGTVSGQAANASNNTTTQTTTPDDAPNRGIGNLPGNPGAPMNESAGENGSYTPSNSTNASPTARVNTTIREFKTEDLGWTRLDQEEKDEKRQALLDLAKNGPNMSKNERKNKVGNVSVIGTNYPERAHVEDIIADRIGVDSNGTVYDGMFSNMYDRKRASDTGGGPVNTTITAFKRKNVGYENLSQSNKTEVRSILQEINESGNISDDKKAQYIGRLSGLMGGGNKDQIKVTLNRNFNFGATATTSNDFPFNIPSLTGQKLRSIGHQMLMGASSFLKEVYDFAFSTPVPKNSGWHNILGEPTNKPFKPLYEKLLNGTLYPVTNLLLGIAVTLIGLSLAVNPLMSRFRAWNLITKFVTFLLLYGFSWTAITLMHGSVHSITMWIRPSPEAMGQLVTNVGKMSGITIGAYFVGSGGIMASAAGLATELAMRNVLLKYFFPYIFAPLVFLLYVSPWERLKSVASMALWQYVNVLTMVIPMAVFLRAATVVKFTTEETLQGMILLIALFGAAAVMPVITTWAFAKMKGQAVAGAKSAAAGAASRAGAMKDKVWGSGSSSDSTATGGMSPGDRAEAAVETTSVGSSSGSSGVPSSGELSDSALEQTGPEGSETATTTAGQVRALHEEEQSSPNSADAKYEAYFREQEERSGPHRTTMQEKLAD